MRKLAPPPVVHRPATTAKPPVFAGASAKTPEQHMARRKASGLSHRAIAQEFNTSKSTSHRKLGGNALKQGFNRLGSADDDI